MFDVHLPEMLVLGIVALLVFGPERLPEVALQAARMIKKLRGMAESARADFGADLEPHLRELRDLKELNPTSLARNYVLEPADGDGQLSALTKKGRAKNAKKKKAADAQPAGATAVTAASAAALADGGSNAATVDGSGDFAATGASAPTDSVTVAASANGVDGNRSGATSSNGSNGSGSAHGDPVEPGPGGDAIPSDTGPAVPLAMVGATSNGPAPFDPDAT